MSGFVSSFEHPLRLWLLLLVAALVVAYILASRRQRFGMRYTNTGMLQRIVRRQSQWRRHAAVAASFLALAAIIVAFAKPLGETQVPRERATIVLVIDTSLSMRAEDVKPNRLEAAKQAAASFIGDVPPRFNVALVALNGNPGLLVQPTRNHAMVSNALKALQLSESTAIGDALTIAIGALSQTPKNESDDKPAPGAIVVLSDGENTAGTAPVQAARDAEKAKVPIYTIAYGTENGYVDVEGQRERVPPDKALLAQLAEVSNGKTFQADSLDGLKEVYSDIASDIGYEPATADVSARFAGIAMALAIVAGFGAVLLSSRWP